MKYEKMYMHINTGSVGTKSEWESDFNDSQKDEETKVDQTFEENFSDNFCEVKKNDLGEYMSVE
jgi:hypothetical protein